MEDLCREWLDDLFYNQYCRVWEGGRLHTPVEKLHFWEKIFARFYGSKELTLGPDDIVSFRQLMCQNTLRYLVADRMTKAMDLDVLGDYTQLNTLFLRDMGIKDISFLASMKNLTDLGLGGNQVHDLSSLAGLEKLRSIYIARNPVRDFSALGQLPALKSLYADIEQLPDQSAWDAIPRRISLKVLRLTPLGNFRYNVETVYDRPLPLPADSSADRQKDPRKLDIKDRWLYSGLINALGYEPTVKYDITKLKRLDCSDNICLCDDFWFLTEPGDYSCLESAVKLRYLNLSGRVVKDYSWLRNCVNLREINLSHTDFSDLELLTEMNQLTTLNLEGCHNLSEDSLQVLKKLPRLKKLKL